MAPPHYGLPPDDGISAITDRVTSIVTNPQPQHGRLEDLLEELQKQNRRYSGKFESPWVDAECKMRFGEVRNPPPRDPLALDLDNDGIETTSANGRILFDHDGDGIRTGTGWVKADDGLLVLDRNANGTIDSGAELFGVDTVLSDGTKATDGFAALRDQDDNADGVFNAADSTFAQIRVWQDLNQDGISQTEELTTLADQGITAISLADTAVGSDLGNGNGVHSQATLTRSDASTGTAYALDLADNPFYSQFPDTIPLTEQAQSLPDMRGSGMVRSLREGASLNADLASVLTAGSVGTRDALDQNLDEILLEWGKTAEFQTTVEGLEMATHYGSSYGWTNIGFQTAYLFNFDAVPDTYYDWAVARYGEPVVDVYSGSREFQLTRHFYSGSVYMDWTDDFIGTLEAFNGLGLVDFRQTADGHWGIFDGGGTLIWGSSDDESVAVNTGGAGGGGGGGGGGVAPDPELRLALDNRMFEGLWESYRALRLSLRGALAVQTYLKPYLDEVSLIIDESGLGFDFSAVDAMLAAKRSTDHEAALLDLVELNLYAKSLGELGWNGLQQTEAWLRSPDTTQAMLDRIWATTGYRVLLGNDTGGTLADADRSRTIAFGGAGNDNLTGSDFGDFLVAGDGRDIVYAGDGDDVIVGGAGDDNYLAGEGGDDRIDGGAGNDTINGGLGSDTYVFGKGDGQDLIYGTLDTGARKVDTLQFKQGVTADEIVMSTVSTSLVIRIAGTSDQVTVVGFLSQDDPGNASNPLQQIRFDDGTVWNLDDILARLFAGTESGETISGTYQADVINGAGGNDYLQGKAGGDTLDGGDGNDAVYGGDGDDVLLGSGGTDNLLGENGDDTLDGGSGNDSINGGLGSDTYLFGKGDGTDSIFSTNDTTVGKIDTLQFKAGVAPGEVTLSTSSTSLVIKIAGTTDQITVYSFLSQDDPNNSLNPLQQIRFDDGTTWSLADIQARLFAGSEGSETISGTYQADAINGAGGNDYLYGKAGSDALDGGDGNDYVYGGDGDDVVQGGAGYDYLFGENGNDRLDGGTGGDSINGGLGNNTYLFGKGDGADTIFSMVDTTADKLNTLQFKAGVLPGEVALSTSTTSLVIKIAGTTDQITVRDYLYQDDPTNSRNPLQQIRFDDGTIWTLADIQARLLAGSEGSETISGTYQADAINGAGGNDYLYGKAGSDTLDGGEGNDYAYGGDGDDVVHGGAGYDYLYGENGNDTLDGGSGGDSINGGLGNDIYLFGKGDGVDTIDSTYDTTAGRIDTLQFKVGVAPGEVTLSTSGTSLLIKIAGTTDQITVRDYLSQDDPNNSRNPLQQIRFDDGTIWTLADIQTRLLAGSEGSETISGTYQADTINGAGGNDYLYGKGGNDTIDGGAGYDYLYGDDGNDSLDGGSGGDYLSGGSGSDTYHFGRGSEHDTISNYDTSGGDDRVLFDAGVAMDQIWFSRNGYSLEVRIVGESAYSTISNWYSSAAYQLDAFELADGSTLMASQVENLVSAMAGFAAPPLGETELNQTYRDALESTIAANWSAPA